MRIETAAFISAVALALAAALHAQQPATAVVAFTNVTVIPMDRETLLPGQTVIVKGEAIADMGPAASVPVPAGATRVDGSGKFLMPSLSEMHAHVPGGQAPDSAIERTLFLYAANGVGTIRGMLGHPRHVAFRTRANAGELFSPWIYTSGPSLNGESVTSPEAGVKMVTEQKQAGYDLLKIHPGLTREAFDAIDRTADALGMPFAGHVPADVGLGRALEARYSTIDHLDGYVEALASDGAPPSQLFGINLMGHVDESRLPDLVTRTKAAGVAQVPTQVLLENWMGDTATDVLAAWPEMKYAQPGQVEQWIAITKKFREAPAADRQTFVALRRRVLKALHDGGVLFLLGSDAPQIWNVPGFSVHRELHALVAAGLTPFEALQTGTINVARHYKTEDRTGSVARGRRASLVLLDANPLEDIRNSSKIAGVYLAGRWVPREEIHRQLGSL